MLQNKNILLDITKRKDNAKDPFHYFLVYKVQYQKKLNTEESRILNHLLNTTRELKEMLTKFEKNIKEKVGADILKISELDPSKKHEFTSKEKVKGKEFELFFDKL